MKKIIVSDITIRKLISDGEISLLFREKAALAKGISSFGADIIELPAIKNIKEDTLVYKTIAGMVKDCTVSINAGDCEESIAAAYECVNGAENKCLTISLPVSTVQMEYMYHVKADKMEKKIEAACRFAASLSEKVEFAALDATRADREFLIKACDIAAKSGAGVITICDDAGVMLPEEISGLVKEIKANIQVPLFVEASDKVNLGIASALAAISAGADGIKICVCGKDRVLAGEFADAINAHGDKLGITTSLKTTEIQSDIRKLIKNISRSGISETASDNGGGILLDSQSSVVEINAAATSLGYELSENDIGLVSEALKRVCEKKSSVGRKEFEAIIASSAMQVPSVYHLDSYTTVCSNKTSALSNIVLIKGDERLVGVATGDGPIDSAFNAIDQSMGFHYELDEFGIQSVTEGKEALGSALVRLRCNGKLYSGNGLSSDIVGASIRAYINAINKIVYDEKIN